MSPPPFSLPPPLLPSEKLAGTKLEVEEIALTAMSQRRKLEVVLEATNRCLQAEEPKWSVDGTRASAGLVSGAGPGAWVPLRGDGFPHPRGTARSPRVWAQPGGLEGGRSLRQVQSGHKGRSVRTNSPGHPVPEVSLQGSPA